MIDLPTRLAELRDDRTHGASELARMALAIAADWSRDCPADDPAELLNQLRRLAARLTDLRPSMAPVANLIGNWRDSLPDDPDRPLPELRETAARLARLARAESEAAFAKTASDAAALVANGSTILTHSVSSTVREAIHQLRDSSVKVILTESRPGLEGRLLARQLSEWKIPVTVITDAAMALFLPRCDLALVGADSITSVGDVVNKSGTFLLALAAREHNVPFYVCAESFKQRPPGMPDPILEEMDPAELGVPDLPGVEASNIYFDVTPARLVTAWIDESGCRREW